MNGNHMNLHQLLGISWPTASTPTSDHTHHHSDLFDDITLDYARCFPDVNQGYADKKFRRSR